MRQLQAESRPDRRGGRSGTRPRSLLLPGLLTALGLLSCGEDTTLTGAALLEVSPMEIDFGPVPAGETRAVEVRLRNSSPSASLDLTFVGLSEGSAPAFAVGEAPAQIPAGQEAIVTVRYVPDDAEPDAGDLEIRSSALGLPVLRVPLRSGRTYPRVAVAPAQLDLGSILAGGAVTRAVRVRSRGDAALTIHRIGLRTGGFHGEPCTRDAQCQQGRCAASSSGRICALPCDEGCPPGFECASPADGEQACLERGDTRPPLARRGFTVTHPALPHLPDLLPGEAASLDVTYAPNGQDRGGAQLIIETNDDDHPVTVVPLIGRPEDLPPVADVKPDGDVPDPILPGTRVAVTGADSFDPEGEALTFSWRFLRRPEGSRATFEDPGATRTAFIVDRPGAYVVTLEVRDPSGQGSTNDARWSAQAIAGDELEVELTWDRPGTDLDLHLVAPGGAVGSLSDCFYDNPRPDWGPPGPEGNPSFNAGPARESIRVTAPPHGVFTIAVRPVAASPAGPTSATVRIRLAQTEVAAYTAALPTTAEAWDVATVSWPSGLITDLDSVR